MPQLVLDRLLETCHSQAAELLVLKLDEPPWLRKEGQWRALGCPPVSRAELEALADDLRAHARRVSADGETETMWVMYGDVALFYVRVPRGEKGRELWLQRHSSEMSPELPV